MLLTPSIGPDTARIPPGSDVNSQVQSLLDEIIALWQACPPHISSNLGHIHSLRQQKDCEKQVGQFIESLTSSSLPIPLTPADQQALQDSLLQRAFPLAQVLFNLEEQHLETVKSLGFAEMIQDFARAARRFDPAITLGDIYQAGRNVMTCALLQVLRGIPVHLTPSIFAYSMLYPYSDNYLDDPHISPADKFSFNQRFARRLRGETVEPINAQEQIICSLVGMIENEYDRPHYPQVYASLLAIHAAQTQAMKSCSLQLLDSRRPLSEAEITRISFEKGGTSVLADGYLVDGDISPNNASCRQICSFMFGFGSFTQLMDDMEDLETDLQDGAVTLATWHAQRGTLEEITNRVFHLGHHVLTGIAAFPVPAAVGLGEIIQHAVNPLLSISAACANRFYPNNYLVKLENHMPVRFTYLKKQRGKMDKQQGKLVGLVEAWMG